MIFKMRRSWWRTARRAVALAFVSVAWLSLAACDKKVEVKGPQKCATSDQCKAGFVCLDGQCSDIRHGAVYLNTGEAARPSQVKNEVNRINENYQKNLEKRMKLPE